MENAREAAESYGLTFSLLADPTLETIAAYGVRHEDGGISGDVARPATLVVDRDGRVVYRELTDDWRVRPRPREILDVLPALPPS